MNRRRFLKTAAAAASTSLLPYSFEERRAPAAEASIPDDFHFTEILDGYLRNLERTTSHSFAVCDFADGTMLKSCLTPSGKTYVSVARMLPAIAEYVAATRQPESFKVRGVEMPLTDLLLQTFRHAFDPAHEHYWAEPPTNKPTQRTVESALVAIALHRLGPEFVAQLMPQDRSNINKWLASCTVVPERENNHAWFTATNQACRLELSRSFPEFKGDEAWMLADLEAMNALAPVGDDGWYSDSPTLPLFDIYNFWTFGNFPLFWSRIIGRRYEKWDAIFKQRVGQFLEKTPYFFAPDGSFPLFGRSLPYRWAILSPMLLGYEMKLWPHSPGLLRKVVRTHVQWWWDMGAYDQKLGKLREPLTPHGTMAATDPYIDNGHPCWAMLSYTLFSIPRSDPFWTAAEEPLPVEKADYAVRFEAPRMLVTGTKSSGQVKWIQARNVPKREPYRDKYTKLVCSSHFPFCALKDKEFAPWDGAVVFRDEAGRCATRLLVTDGRLAEDGVDTTWTTKLNGADISIRTEIRMAGEFEFRRHTLQAGGAKLDGWEFIDGSYALPMSEDEPIQESSARNWRMVRSRQGYVVMTWRLNGFRTNELSTAFGQGKESRVNIVHPKVVVLANTGKLDAGGPLVFSSLHFASPKPPVHEAIERQATSLVKRWS